MFPRWWRLGIRPQLTIIVILGAILSTVATLFIADNAIQNYVLQQAQTQEIDNMKIANLVLQTKYGENVSISSDNKLVVDTPVNGNQLPFDQSNGKYFLNNDVEYVDYVSQLIGNSVSVYQCADAHGDYFPCVRVATTFTTGNAQLGQQKRETNTQIASSIAHNMNLGFTPHEWQGIETIDGQQYYSDYAPIFNPQQQFIGALSVSVPLNTITGVVTRTTIELILIGSIIMVAGIILALFLASTIVGTLQRAARQVSGASERIGGIAVQQANGAAQQVWAINAINQALQNFSETARDIAQRTDQLALMGNQVLQRRTEISPAQIDSILAYITRSVRDISVASRQQAAQYERMTGAMQAVIEIAEQVAGSSQQSTESAERMEIVVRQLRQLVGVRLIARPTTSEAMDLESMPDMMAGAGRPEAPRSTVRAVRPSRRAALDQHANDAASAGMGMGQMGQMPMISEAAGQMQPAEPGAGAHGRGAMGGMAAAGAPRGNNAGAMPSARMMNGMGMGNAQGAQRPMNGNMGMGMPGPDMRGAQRGGMPSAGGTGDMENYDWRLPPMPEMPPLPNLSGLGQGPSRTHGEMSGPNGASHAPGQDERWPMSLRDPYDRYGRDS